MTWSRELTPNAGYAPTPAAGQAINDDLNRFWPIVDPWESWTPTALTGVTVGNGAWQASWFDVQGRAHFDVSFLLGSTSAITGAIAFGGYESGSGLSLTDSWGGGLASYYDSSADRWYHGTVVLVTLGDSVAFKYDGANATATVPFTFGSGDYISAQFDMRIAGQAETLRNP